MLVHLYCANNTKSNKKHTRMNSASLASSLKVLPTVGGSITEHQASNTESTLDASLKPSEILSSSCPSSSSDVENPKLSSNAPRSCAAHPSSSELPSKEKKTTLEFSFGCYVGEVHPENPQLRHGEGRLVYANGNVYTGHWKDGAPNGFGEKQYINGDTFVGFWVNGKREGKGSYLFQEGHIFEGMYVNDQAEGYGTLHTIEDDRYSGGWKNGLKDGAGIECLHTGEIFTGTWRGSKKVGGGALRLPGSEKPLYGMWENNSLVRELTVEEIKEWKEAIHHPDWVSTKPKLKTDVLHKSGRGTQEAKGEPAERGSSFASVPRNPQLGGGHLVHHEKESDYLVTGEDPIIHHSDANDDALAGVEKHLKGAKEENIKAVTNGSRDGPCGTSSFSPPTTSLPGYPRSFLPGERGDEWDEEFERNSSDDERDAGAMHASSAPAPLSSCDEKEQLEMDEPHAAAIMRETLCTDGAAADTTTTPSPSLTSALESHFSSSSVPWMDAVAPSSSILQNLSSSPNTKLATLEQSILSMEAKLNLLQTALENAMKEDDA